MEREAGQRKGQGRAITAVVALLGVCCCAALALGYLPPRHGGAVTAPLPEQPLTLDPIDATRSSELQLIRLIYDTLYRKDGKGRVVPHLASAVPEVVEPGAIRLPLRAGVRWHDGQRLTADQVAAALGRLKAGANGYLLAAVETISVDKGGVVLRGALTPARAAGVLAAPQAAVAVRRGEVLVGTGPFRLVRRDRQAIELRVHAEYFAGRPYLDRLIFKRFARSSAEVASFQVGATQISLHGISVFGGTPRYRPKEVVTEPLGIAFLALGRKQALGAEPLFRLALQLAIDRQRLRKMAGTGPTTAADGPVAPGLLRYDTPRRPFDRAMARRLLDRLARRHPALAAPKRLRVALMIDATRFDDRPIADQVVADLDRVRIAARIDARPAAEYQKRLSGGEFELAVGRLTPSLAEGRLALAAALALARRDEEARQCMAARRCGAAEARRFARQLHFVPLVHAASRIHYDARLGGLQPDRVGHIPYDSVYWRRKR